MQLDKGCKWRPDDQRQSSDRSQVLNQPPSIPPCQGGSFKPPLTRGGLEGLEVKEISVPKRREFDRKVVSFRFCCHSRQTQCGEVDPSQCHSGREDRYYLGQA